MSGRSNGFEPHSNGKGERGSGPWTKKAPFEQAILRLIMISFRYVFCLIAGSACWYGLDVNRSKHVSLAVGSRARSRTGTSDQPMLAISERA
jgi:hypothetical protein